MEWSTVRGWPERTVSTIHANKDALPSASPGPPQTQPCGAIETGQAYRIMKVEAATITKTSHNALAQVRRLADSSGRNVSVLTMNNEFYERFGEVGWASGQQARTRVALGLAKTITPSAILDIGCADGEVTETLGQITGARVVGVDIAETAVQAARRRGIEAYRVDLNGEQLPFQDGTFGLVYMAEVIEHLAAPDRAFRELSRVLEPGGHLLLTTPNLACLPNRLLLLAGLQPLYSEVSTEVVLGRGHKILGQRGDPVGHLRLYTRRSLREFLEFHGFEVVRLRGAAFHGSGLLGAVESAVSRLSGLAMQLIALGRKRA